MAVQNQEVASSLKQAASIKVAIKIQFGRTSTPKGVGPTQKFTDMSIYSPKNDVVHRGKVCYSHQTKPMQVNKTLIVNIYI